MATAGSWPQLVVGQLGLRLAQEGNPNLKGGALRHPGVRS
jgi:hypothetical protein